MCHKGAIVHAGSGDSPHGWSMMHTVDSLMTGNVINLVQRPISHDNDYITRAEDRGKHPAELNLLLSISSDVFRSSSPGHRG